MCHDWHWKFAYLPSVEWLLFVQWWPMLFMNKLINVNSLWQNNTIWRHRSSLNLAQIMACGLETRSHNPNQCWRIIKGILWYSPENHFTRSSHDNYPYRQFGDDTYLLYLPWVNELIHGCSAKAPGSVEGWCLLFGNIPHVTGSLLCETELIISRAQYVCGIAGDNTNNIVFSVESQSWWVQLLCYRYNIWKWANIPGCLVSESHQF